MNSHTNMSDNFSSLSLAAINSMVGSLSFSPEPGAVLRISLACGAMAACRHQWNRGQPNDVDGAHGTCPPAHRAAQQRPQRRR